MNIKDLNIHTDDLLRMYNEENMSMYAISNETGLSVGYVKKLLDSTGVPLKYKKRGAKKKELHHSWTGGVHINPRNGYRYVIKPETVKGKSRYVAEHRLVWVKEHGKIPKGMVIHHINGDRLDNRIENLSMVSRSENSHHNEMYIKRINELEKEVLRLKKLVGE